MSTIPKIDTGTHDIKTYTVSQNTGHAYYVS